MWSGRSPRPRTPPRTPNGSCVKASVASRDSEFPGLPGTEPAALCGPLVPAERPLAIGATDVEHRGRPGRARDLMFLSPPGGGLCCPRTHFIDEAPEVTGLPSWGWVGAGVHAVLQRPGWLAVSPRTSSLEQGGLSQPARCRTLNTRVTAGDMRPSMSRSFC